MHRCLPRGIKEYPAALQLNLTGDHSTGASLIADDLDIEDVVERPPPAFPQP